VKNSSGFEKRSMVGRPGSFAAEVAQTAAHMEELVGDLPPLHRRCAQAYAQALGQPAVLVRVGCADGRELASAIGCILNMIQGSGEELDRRSIGAFDLELRRLLTAFTEDGNPKPLADYLTKGLEIEVADGSAILLCVDEDVARMRAAGGKSSC
jgi:hypothetical protein